MDKQKAIEIISDAPLCWEYYSELRSRFFIKNKVNEITDWYRMDNGKWKECIPLPDTISSMIPKSEILKIAEGEEMKDKIYPAFYRSADGYNYLYLDAVNYYSFVNAKWRKADKVDASEHENDKNITHEYLANIWGVVESKEHAEFIIELAELHGYSIKGCSTDKAKCFAFYPSYGRLNKELYFYDTDKSTSLSKRKFKQITIPLPPKPEPLKNAGDNLILGCEQDFKKARVVASDLRKDMGCSDELLDKSDDVNDKSFAGVATIGSGKYRSRAGSSKLKSYKVWEGMITRCYVVKSNAYNRYGGRGVKVCDAWLNYQNFAAWYESNPKSNIPGFELDKDLTSIGAKLYSPEFCDLIPRRVNSLLISTNSKRGGLPVGVHRFKDKFKSSCRDEFGSKIHLGTFNNQSEAFLVYKNFKKGVVVTIANEEYKKGNISEKVYRNLINMDITPFPE